MERLTKRNEIGLASLNLKCPEGCEYVTSSFEEGYQCQHQCEGDIIEKLAEYEDLEEQGLLLRLPCKVGSPLYRVYIKPTKCTAYGEYKDDYICQGCEEECDSSYIWAIYKYKGDIKTIVTLSDEIGKTVFLGRVERLDDLHCKELQASDVRELERR